jgi:hypothetical protein
MKSLLPLLEVVVWLGWLGWASSVWIRGDPVWGVVLLGLLVVSTLPLAWSLSGDLLAGVWIGLEGGLDEGARLRVGDHVGVVRRLGVRWVEVQTDDGWSHRIPYRRLHDQIGVEPEDGGRALRLSLPAPVGVDGPKTLELVAETVGCSPWSVVGDRPRVMVDDDQRLTVECRAVSEAAAAWLRSDVVRAWQRVLEAMPPGPRAPSVRSGSVGPSEEAAKS